MEMKKISKWIVQEIKDCINTIITIIIIIISLLIIGFALKYLAPDADAGAVVAKIAIFGIILYSVYIGYKGAKKN